MLKPDKVSSSSRRRRESHHATIEWEPSVETFWFETYSLLKINQKYKRVKTQAQVEYEKQNNWTGGEFRSICLEIDCSSLAWCQH